MRRIESLSVGKLFMDSPPIAAIAVTVATGVAIGRSAISKALKGAVALGILPNGNQDQFVDSVEVIAPVRDIEGITLTDNDPVLVAITGHPFSTGDRVSFAGIVGTTELNGKQYIVTKEDADSFSLDDTDSADFTAYTSDGTATADEYGEAVVTLADNATADNEFIVSAWKVSGGLVKE